MKICLTGADGVLGKLLLEKGCIPVLGDIRNQNDITTHISHLKPDVLIHCAALTNVAYCEDHFDDAFEVNVRGTSNVVGAMPKNSVMIYISTDHVFSGRHWLNFGYTERHTPSPVNNYGFTKWGGEIALETGECKSIVIRTSRAYSYELMKPTLEPLMRGEDVVLTNLIKRSFMYLPHLIDGIMWVANNSDKIDQKIINISGESIFSYSSFWQIIANYLKLPGKVIPRNTEIKEAPRPFRAGLDTRLARKLGVPLGNLGSALSELEGKIKNE